MMIERLNHQVLAKVTDGDGFAVWVRVDIGPRSCVQDLLGDPLQGLVAQVLHRIGDEMRETND